MNANLRPYQENAIKKVRDSFNKGHKKDLIVLPTGLGKTICMAAIAEDEVNNGGKVLFLAHRNTLLKQGAEEIEKMTGIPTGYLSGKHFPKEQIVISSIQCLNSSGRLQSFPRDEYSLIMIDEAHHILAESYKKILNYFDTAKVLGVTATPKRSDKNNISTKFDDVASEYTLTSAIKDGWLSPIVVRNCPVKINISDVRMQTGDYSAGDIGAALIPYMEKIADEIIDKAGNRKTLIFVPLVATAKGLTKIFKDKGINADYVAGERKDSPEIMEKFKKGEIKILINSMLLTEGYNEPSVDAIVNLRITKSETLLTQIVGRGTRKAPGKENLLILDFFWKSRKDKQTLSIADIVTGELDVDEKDRAEVIRRCKNDKSDGQDIFNMVMDYARDVKKEREDALLRALKRAEEEKRLEEERMKRKSLGNPLNVSYMYIQKLRKNPNFIYELRKENKAVPLSEKCYKIMSGKYGFIFALDPVLTALGLDFCPYWDKGKWFFDKATEAQVFKLSDYGIPHGCLATKGYCAFLINNLVERRNNNLCSYKQAKLLMRNGISDCKNISFDTARKAISSLSNNGWRRTGEFYEILRNVV